MEGGSLSGWSVIRLSPFVLDGSAGADLGSGVQIDVAARALPGGEGSFVSWCGGADIAKSVSVLPAVFREVLCHELIFQWDEPPSGCLDWLGAKLVDAVCKAGGHAEHEVGGFPLSARVEGKSGRLGFDGRIADLGHGDAGSHVGLEAEISDAQDGLVEAKAKFITMPYMTPCAAVKQPADRPADFVPIVCLGVDLEELVLDHGVAVLAKLGLVEGEVVFGQESLDLLISEGRLGLAAAVFCCHPGELANAGEDFCFGGLVGHWRVPFGLSVTILNQTIQFQPP